MSDTATIETLTAEVRTLMVGSRQVTLSVAKQLDEVNLKDLEVFGRVKIHKDRTHVIGSDQHGALAVARYEDHPLFHRPWIGPEHLGDTGTIYVCSAWKTDYNGWYSLRFAGGPSFEVDPEAVEKCGNTDHNGYYSEGAKCESWSSNGMDSIIVAELDSQSREKERMKALHAAAASSPLIVLAGLK